MREQLRQKGQPGKTKGRCHLRGNDALSVVEVLEFGTEKVRDELHHVENGGDEGKAGNGNLVLPVKCQEKKRRKVGDNGLRDKSQVAGPFCFSIVFHLRYKGKDLLLIFRQEALYL